MFARGTERFSDAKHRDYEVDSIDTEVPSLELWSKLAGTKIIGDSCSLGLAGNGWKELGVYEGWF